MSQDKILNGVNVSAVESTVSAVEENPDLAKFKFRLHNKWIDGGHNHSTVTNFYGTNQEISHLNKFELDSDEPPVLAGDVVRNADPDRGLLVLLALAVPVELDLHPAELVRIDLLSGGPGHHRRL